MLNVLAKNEERTKYASSIGKAVDAIDLAQNPDQESSFWQLVGKGRGVENYELPQAGRDREEMDEAKWRHAMQYAQLVSQCSLQSL